MTTTPTHPQSHHAPAAHAAPERTEASERDRRDGELRSQIAELSGAVEHFRAAMSAITREEDPGAMKSIAAAALAGVTAKVAGKVDERRGKD